MRISSKARYATIALMDIASRNSDSPITLSDISKRQNISVSYLEQIFAKLRRGSLVTASRGPGGGYKLSRSADEISLSDIAVIFNKEPLTAESVQGNVAKTGWYKFSEDLRGFLGNVTLGQYVKASANSEGSISSAA